MGYFYYQFLPFTHFVHILQSLLPHPPGLEKPCRWRSTGRPTRSLRLFHRFVALLFQLIIVLFLFLLSYLGNLPIHSFPTLLNSRLSLQATNKTTQMGFNWNWTKRIYIQLLAEYSKLNIAMCVYLPPSLPLFSLLFGFSSFCYFLVGLTFVVI